MATEVRWRRGTTAQHATFTGAQGEVSVDTDKKTLVVHDGATAGGFPLGQETVLDGKADAGANSDITSLSGLTTPLSIAQGGTGANTAPLARTALGTATAGALGSSGITGAAASGANSDITSLSALTNGIVGTSGNQTIGGTKTFSVMPVLPTQSMVRLNTANGYGSSSTMIRRFTNVVTNQGTDITYADSATLGATFTINTNGVYGISYSDTFNDSDPAGISLNSSQLTTAISAITSANCLAISQTVVAGSPTNVAVTVYLPAGSVIRAHTGGTPAFTAKQYFAITRIS